MLNDDARCVSFLFFCGLDNGRERYTNFVIAFLHIFLFSVGLLTKHQQDMNDTGKSECERGCVTGFLHPILESNQSRVSNKRRKV